MFYSCYEDSFARTVMKIRRVQFTSSEIAYCTHQPLTVYLTNLHEHYN